MSGGVDSSVAAARLLDAGHEPVGVTLRLWDAPGGTGARHRCCAPEDVRNARNVAAFLGIPHYSFDRRAMFAAEIVAPFVDAYLSGLTPSPCVWCNRQVKLGELFTLAARLGAVAVATGHYARVGRRGGRHELWCGRDPAKDQSYFLYSLPYAALARLVFPLGDSLKADVRAEAARRGLPGAAQGESQELCFVPSSSYAPFVEERAAGRVRAGPIVDGAGRRLGRHGGVHRFTVGQRRGLGLAAGRPLFVVGIDVPSATVTVGGASELYSAAAVLSESSWAQDVTFPLRATVKVRYRHAGTAAVLAREPDLGTGRERIVARFVAPVRAVAPGQALVAYEGDRVLGGGTIGATLGPGGDR
ncbi:MAG: tRNA 2-thiouridine(34) synthase MnmA [Deltaproteobacteria bacterium]|nr:tRNA 2-thiouridine(34) synthase MnmA [Deltaproteobacteria bacterium]